MPSEANKRHSLSSPKGHGEDGAVGGRITNAARDTAAIMESEEGIFPLYCGGDLIGRPPVEWGNNNKVRTRDCAHTFVFEKHLKSKS